MDENLSYSYNFTVSPGDIDELEHVNNVVYVQWIQDAAVKHWNKIAPEDIKKNFVWVIARHEIDYKRPAKLNDELFIQTRVLTAGAVNSERLVQIFRKNDMQLLVESKTNWIMIDAVSHRPVRIPDVVKEIFLGRNEDKND